MRSRMNRRLYAKESTGLGDFPVSVENKARKPRIVAIIALFLILLIGGIFLFTQLHSNATKTAQISPTPSLADTPTTDATATPTVSVSPSLSQTPTPADKTTGALDKATGLDRKALTVGIENGSGVPGAASKVAATLKTAGYTIGTTGNAATFDYKDVTIQVKSTKASYLPLLKNDLAAAYTVGSATKDLAASESADAVVIVGK